MAAHPHRTDSDGLTFRPFASLPDYEACIELQRLTWGRDFSDAVPMSMLKVTQKAGGIAAGAFAADGRILGFIYGLAGYVEGRPFHWSHMLAVHPEARDLGLGTRLKLYQREVLLAAGVEEVRWTYDPLEARNANLNLNHLGAEVAEYVEEMYEGEMGELAKGIGTDRFIVSWRIAGERVARALADHRRGEDGRFRDAPIANPGAAERDLPDASRVRIEIPENIQVVKVEQPESAMAWRASTRRAFETCLARGYKVEAFYREGGRCFYGLEKLHDAD
ncbi:MAG TPA: GNAT family N-acetyltransferase [Thermoanaerobaculia bacterium]|jgi:predicted GNAT superfamily acetyltransferase